MRRQGRKDEKKRGRRKEGRRAGKEGKEGKVPLGVLAVESESLIVCNVC